MTDDQPPKELIERAEDVEETARLAFRAAQDESDRGVVLVGHGPDSDHIIALMDALEQAGRGLSQVATKLGDAAKALRSPSRPRSTRSDGPEDVMGAVQKALSTHGLNAELDAVQALNRAKLWVTLHPTYFDRDGGTTREYDIAASCPEFLGRPVSTGLVPVVLALAIEVKTSRDPWVVIRPPEETTAHGNRPYPVAHISAGVVSPGSLRDWLLVRQHPLYAEDCDEDDVWFGTSVVEPFAKSRGSGGRNEKLLPSFEARLKACKAAEDLRYWHKARLDQDLASIRPVGSSDSVVVVKPVVVLRGPLFAYWRDSNGDGVLQTVQAASITQEFRTKQYDHGVYSLDIVSDTFVEEYGRRTASLARDLRRFVDGSVHGADDACP